MGEGILTIGGDHLGGKTKSDGKVGKKIGYHGKEAKSRRKFSTNGKSVPKLTFNRIIKLSF